MREQLAEVEIVKFIDKIVTDTGYPILGMILQQNGVASRSTLRKMEREGKLTSVDMLYKGQYVIAYHVKGVEPRAFELEKNSASQSTEVMG